LFEIMKTLPQIAAQNKELDAEAGDQLIVAGS
jgi:hypothetical protein